MVRPRAASAALIAVFLLSLVMTTIASADDTHASVEVKDLRFVSDDALPRLGDENIVQDVGRLAFQVHCGPGYVNSDQQFVTIGLSAAIEVDDLRVVLTFDERAVTESIRVPLDQQSCLQGGVAEVAVGVIASWDRLVPAGRLDEVVFTATQPDDESVTASANLTVPAWLSVAPGSEAEGIVIFTGTGNTTGETAVTWAVAANGPFTSTYESVNSSLVALDFAWAADHAPNQARLRVTAQDVPVVDERQEETVPVPVTVTSDIDPEVTVSFEQPVTIRLVPPPEGAAAADGSDGQPADDAGGRDSPGPLLPLTLLAFAALAAGRRRR